MSGHLPLSWPQPRGQPHAGTLVELAPTDVDADVEELHAAGRHEAIWQHMPCGPFADAAAMAAWMKQWVAQPDVVCFTVTHRSSRRRVGMISIMRIAPAHGVAELGCIWYTPDMQRTKANTESVFLLLRHLFDDLGYRRVEWKCDSRNERSRAAALRLGFQFEGLFRQHMVVKGDNRDTAWFAMLDADWPNRKVAFERWLRADGSTSLRSLNAAHQQGMDP